MSVQPKMTVELVPDCPLGGVYSGSLRVSLKRHLAPGLGLVLQIIPRIRKLTDQTISAGKFFLVDMMHIFLFFLFLLLFERKS